MWAVYRSIRLIRITLNNPSLYELVYRLSAKRLAGVRRIFLSVVFPNPTHDRSDAHERILH